MKTTLTILVSLILSVCVWVLMYLYFPVSIFDSKTFGSTITTIQGSDTLSASRSVINTNFSNLNTDKLESGSTATTLTVGTLTLTNDLTVANGGTGASTLTGVLLGNGASAFTTESPLTVPNGGTGWASLMSGYILFGNTASRIATSSSLFFDSTNGRFGLGSTTPAYGLSIGSGKAIGVQENAVATSSSITIDARNGNQQLVQMGSGNMTIAFSNFGIGTTIRLIVCNPLSTTAGTITWSGVQYFGGTPPAQTTTAQKCDLYVVGSTAATSSPAITPKLYLSQGGAGL